MQECVSKSGKTSVFEFELDQLSVECLNELETYVKKTIKDNEKKQKRRETKKEKEGERIGENEGNR